MLAGAHAAEIVLNAAGDGKVNANEAEPLTPEARSRLTASVDAAYARMVQDIAAGRGVPDRPGAHGLEGAHLRRAGSSVAWNDRPDRDAQ